ncbi:peptide deformylase [Gulosibacter faecalis]|jgi:peptide deformylase|uniref:Peptide deformylase n=1 Tax=Gulosibacter faecalis TaxID=272240 RepID=A0ABW5UYJ3_9MICO|nr:peptide deformylase [Gulosibacter faecalis]
MSILPIRIYGEPVLHSPAAPVDEVSPEVRSLVDDMFETMAAAPGVGLAAPQVGVGLRMFVYGWQDDEGTEHRGVAINPELWLAPPVPESFEELTEDEEEGCLSFPGERFELRRSPAVLLRAQDLEGKPYELRAEGWLARILQHEYDHLDGVIYADRLQLPARKQAFKIMRKRGWNVPGKQWVPGEDNLEG